jgi:hypothetical protein
MMKTTNNDMTSSSHAAMYAKKEASELTYGEHEEARRIQIRMHELLIEARHLANQINADRFEGVVPSSEATVRLVEVMDILNGEYE